MSESIDHQGTDSVVCPHCGYAEGESYERLDGTIAAGKDNCAECGKEFTWEADFEVTYNTYKIEPETAASKP